MSDNGIQHKPSYQAGVQFEDSRPVLTTQPFQEPDAAEELLYDLLDLGVKIRNPAAALDAINSALDKHGDARAAECLAIIFARLPKGYHGALLRKALLAGAEITTEDAAEFNLPRQTWWRSISRLRAKIVSHGIQS